MKHKYTESSREERIAIINRMWDIKGHSPSVSIVMHLWLLNEKEARQLLAEASKVSVVDE